MALNSGGRSMRKYHFYDGLLVAAQFISADCSALLKVPSPAADTENTQQAISSTTHNTPEIIPHLLAQFLKKYKKKPCAHMKTINYNSDRLWNNWRPDRKIIRLVGGSRG